MILVNFAQTMVIVVGMILVALVHMATGVTGIPLAAIAIVVTFLVLLGMDMVEQWLYEIFNDD